MFSTSVCLDRAWRDEIAIIIIPGTQMEVNAPICFPSLRNPACFSPLLFFCFQKAMLQDRDHQLQLHAVWDSLQTV